MNYLEFKETQSKEFNAFPLACAFSDEQLTRAKEKLQVTGNDELVSIGGGCVIRKLDVDTYYNLINKQYLERSKYLDNIKNLESALRYELNNHEYIYTHDPSDALSALGLDLDTLTDEQRLALKRAAKKHIENTEA